MSVDQVRLSRERLEELEIVLTNRWVELTRIDEELEQRFQRTDPLRLDLRIVLSTLAASIKRLRGVAWR